MPSDRLSNSQSFSYGTSKSVSINSGANPGTAYKLQLLKTPKDEKPEKSEKKSSLKQLSKQDGSASTSSFSFEKQKSFRDSFSNLNDYKLNRYKTSLMSETVNKFKFPSVEKNSPFQIIRNHLTNKHREAVQRPSFNAAGIRPVENHVLFARELTIHRLDNYNSSSKSSLKATSLTRLNSLEKPESKPTPPAHLDPVNSYHHFHSTLSTPLATRTYLATDSLRHTATTSHTRLTYTSNLKGSSNKQASSDSQQKTKRVTLQLFDEKPSSLSYSDNCHTNDTTKDEYLSSDTERTLSTPVSKSTATPFDFHHHQNHDSERKNHQPKIFRHNTFYQTNNNTNKSTPQQQKIRFSLLNNSEIIKDSMSFDDDKSSDHMFNHPGKTPVNSRQRIAPIYKNIPSLAPKIEKDYTDSEIRLQQSYKQSGASIRDLEQSRVATYGRNFKVNVGAPKVWLKSKYLPNSKLDTSFLSPSSKVTYLVSN